MIFPFRLRQSGFRVLTLGLLAALSLAPPAVARVRLSQVQVARQFLLAVLRADYNHAYQLLAPEVSAAVTPARFRAAARPLYEKGQQFQPAIDLYKLGMRIQENNDVRHFYSFMFKSDTLAAKPEVQLDVTFRDSTATRILSFGLIPAPQTKARRAK
ncbi:hypothetical protein [Hymenobacter persicinus]|uniref:DUF3887 domain-containing protein n=1 Tax=Hymenobacter persicinus TaxID=2025506 RepID=A0A4Q5LG74_9BACT|nr:hypothetical protein [Hymenobacter persicinus]RYU84349.1 hypothetical protein EWM57_01265 [Hymenobacter persicinus]